MGLRRLKGNGDTEHRVLVEEKAPGYVVFAPENLLDVPDQFPIHLSLCFDRWLKQNPGVRIRETLPIVEDGRTLVLHVWFDLV